MHGHDAGGIALEVVWMATDDSGQLPSDLVTSTLDDLRARVRALRAGGEGYVIVSRPGNLYPVLLVGFRGEDAVVHLQPDDETMILLNGDGSVPDDQQADVLIIEETATFPGDVVMTVDHALEI